MSQAMGENAAGDLQLIPSNKPNATWTDRSGTCTTGAADQVIAAAKASRRWFFFQNISDTTMWLNFGVVAVASQPSIQVLAGAILRFDTLVDVGAVHMLCATTGKAFVAKEV